MSIREWTAPTVLWIFVRCDCNMNNIIIISQPYYLTALLSCFCRSRG